jgi:hypothetical protein
MKWALRAHGLDLEKAQTILGVRSDKDLRRHDDGQI